MRRLVSSMLLLSACASSNAGEDATRSVAQVTTPTTTNAVDNTAAPATTSSGGTDGAPASSADGATSTPETAPDDALVRPADFETTQAVVTGVDGTTCEICVWLADTSDQRSRGLMFVTDLGIGDAMAFRYPEPHTGTFWMKNTILPLSIAFFAPDGMFMTSFDMEPCTTDACPSYATADGFSVAVEVPQGGLAELGIGPGSTLDLLDLPCD